MSSNSGPLTERSPNTTSPSKSQTIVNNNDSDPVKPNEKMANTRAQELTQKEAQNATYVSPSDNILSPTTKKLSAIKGKRFANARGQSLFAKTVAKEGLKSQEKLNLVSSELKQ